MKRSMNEAWSERVFRVLLRAYPNPFRARYETELLGFFRKHREDAGDRLVAFWLRTVWDLSGSALRQRFKLLRTTGPARDLRRGGVGMATVLQDLKYAWRSFRRAPAFVALAVTTLALGIGSATGIFSVVDGVLIRALPYPDSQELVAMGSVFGGSDRLGPMSPGHFRDLSSRMTTVTDVVVVQGRRVTLLGKGDPRATSATNVSEGFFRLIGAQPLLGRDFVADDFVATARDVTLISYGLWQEEWGSDPGVLGKSLLIGDQSFEVVGVMPEGLSLPGHLSRRGTRVWFPLRLDDALASDLAYGRYYLDMTGRMRPGVSPRLVEEEAGTIMAQVGEEFHPDFVVGAKVRPLKEQVLGRRIGRTLTSLLGAVGLLLLIACANVANVLLARGTDRARELALRSVLGARRGRIVRQLMTEGVLIGLTGGVLGVGMAYFGVKGFQAISPGGIPRLAEVVVDLRVLVVAVLASLATAVLFSLAPAVQAVRAAPAEALKEGAASSTAGRSRNRLRGGLVIVEISLAMVLLVGAGLLVNSLARLAEVDPGFEVEGLATVKVSLRNVPSEEWSVFFTQVLEGVRALPGVESAGLSSAMPFTSDGVGTHFTPEGWDPDLPDSDWVSVVYTDGDYFEAMEIPLLEGRRFGPNDVEGADLVAIVNKAWSDLYLPDVDRVVGTRMFSGRPDDIGEPWITIVGVVGDVHTNLKDSPPPNVYIPNAQESWRNMSVIARTAGDPTLLLAGMRQAVWTVDRNRAIDRATTLAELSRSSILRPRFYTTLVGTFAVLALLIAVVGIYGSISYSVGQRHREMGIRVALGAERGSVMRMVVAGGARLAGVGLLLGVGGALLSGRFIRSFLFEVEPTDPATIVLTGLVLLGTALLACFVPALRATRVDPVRALRSDT